MLEVCPDDWGTVLQQWLRMRRQLRDELAIPVRDELHAVDFLAGRGNPSLDQSWNRRPNLRLAAGLTVVNALARLPVQWRVVYGLGHDRRNVYVAALRDLEADLIASGDHALVMIDGDGTDPVYLEAHRALPIDSRRVLEDPWYQPSHSNQWIMMADWVAYLAFQQVSESRPLLATWYSSFLAVRDVNGGPVHK